MVGGCSLVKFQLRPQESTDLASQEATVANWKGKGTPYFGEVYTPVNSHSNGTWGRLFPIEHGDFPMSC